MKATSASAVSEVPWDNNTAALSRCNSACELHLAHSRLELEPWAKGLMHCDMEVFALLADGTLVLLDECGAYRYPP